MGGCLGFQEEEKTHPTMTRRPPSTTLKVTLGSSPSPTPTPSLRLSTLPLHSRTDGGTPWPSACGMHLCPHFLSCAQWDTRACSHNYTHTPPRHSLTVPVSVRLCTHNHTETHIDTQACLETDVTHTQVCTDTHGQTHSRTQTPHLRGGGQPHVTLLPFPVPTTLLQGQEPSPREELVREKQGGGVLCVIVMAHM